MTIQFDEMWSYVGSQTNKKWIGLAIDVSDHSIVGVYIGDRSRESAQGFWQSLPGVYRQCVICYIDFWEAYQIVLLSMRHKAVGKETGQTSYIERFNNTIVK